MRENLRLPGLLNPYYSVSHAFPNHDKLIGSLSIVSRASLTCFSTWEMKPVRFDCGFVQLTNSAALRFRNRSFIKKRPGTLGRFSLLIAK